MSVKIMSMVFERYPNGGGEMMLALALADHASDDGTKVYPSIKALAAKTRQSERTVQYQLRRMEESGWLILVNSGNGGRNQHREYNISPEWIKGADFAPVQSTTVKGAIDDTKGAIHDSKGCNPLHPHITIIEPSRTVIEPSSPAKLALPDWLPADVWADWVAHRKAVKSVMTERAAQLCIKKLEKLRAEGNDPVAVIEQSIMSGKWTDLYAIKGSNQHAGHRQPTNAERNADWDARMNAVLEQSLQPARQPMKDMGKADAII